MTGVTAPAASPAPLRRDPANGMIAGVCSGLGRHLGIDPLILRIAFVVASIASGVGVLAYLIAWATMGTAGGGESRLRLVAARPGAWQVAAGIGLLTLSVMLLLRHLGLWFGDVLVWPVALAATGGALIWRQSQSGGAKAPTVAAAPSAAPAVPAPLDTEARSRTALGAALVLGGALVFLWLSGALRPARDVILAVVVVVVAGGVILAPWWIRLARGLATERAERIRSQERAEVAAHLHDSVLQTLALMQKRADDPRAVSTLARRQERELRAWLNGADAPGAGNTLTSALERAAADVEEAYGVPVEVVTVGDRPLDERTEALIAATREALTNAAKFAPGAPISLYAEATPERVQVFVRDRGPGFDPDAVPDDRRGVRESILGRMRRHGGTADITASAAGTEVELTV
jgi:signal transduction histidine kinase